MWCKGKIAVCVAVEPDLTKTGSTTFVLVFLQRAVALSPNDTSLFVGKSHLTTLHKTDHANIMEYYEYLLR